ncbi:IS3 family transposase, partial [Streptomyces sp. NPDC006864]|uniref:IS3 family transposase n=1 Tax=Streptomyces sp. NPDC006864 TaxID=3154780 RepID=UPI003451DE89
GAAATKPLRPPATSNDTDVTTNRDQELQLPCQLPLFLRSWHTDITYLPVEGGKFCYMATVIDLASRRLAGWAIADHLRADLVTDALAAAIRTRGSLAGSIMHTDHGALYTSRIFAEACRSAEVRRSMSAVGSSADNALAESFNATFKRETLQGRKSWPDEREARLDALRRLHRYNTRRRHSYLGQRSPIAFEEALQLTPTTLAQAA